MRRALSALLAVVVAAFAVAGCGDSSSSNTVPSKAEYKQTYASLNKEIDTLGLAVGKAINNSSGKSNKAIAKEFNDLADQATALAKKIDDTTPPDDAAIRSAQAALVAGLNTAAGDLSAIGKASEKKDPKAAGAAAGKLTRDNAGVANPHAQLNKIVLGIVPAPVKTSGGSPKTTTTAP
jgi:hypothetical protein